MQGLAQKAHLHCGSFQVEFTSCMTYITQDDMDLEKEQGITWLSSKSSTCFSSTYTMLTIDFSWVIILLCHPMFPSHCWQSCFLSMFSFISVICHKLWRNNDMGSWLRLLTAYKIGLLPHWSAVGSLEVSIRDIVRCVDHRLCSLKFILAETQA